MHSTEVEDRDGVNQTATWNTFHAHLHQNLEQTARRLWDAVLVVLVQNRLERDDALQGYQMPLNQQCFEIGSLQ